MEFINHLTNGVRIFDLSVPMQNGMAHSPSHQPYSMSLSRRHGDKDRTGTGGTSASALIITGDHVGTHIDAICHVALKGTLYGGVTAADACHGGRFVVYGAETIEPMLCRGVFLDIAALKGKTRLEPAYGITADDLQDALGDTPVNEGDVVLIRTGWIQLYSDAAAYLGDSTGAPGIDESGGKWLASHKVRAAGADTLCFDVVELGPRFNQRPCHGVLLLDNAIHIIEVMDLEELSKEKVKEFVFVLSPLKLVGATGSPVRPLALVKQ
jgi:kynurenine formamidase